MKLISLNRKALYDYEVLESLEAGLVLSGTEIKSIRQGQVNLRGAYAIPEDGELWLVGVHIAPYSHGNVQNQEPTRKRKLLLHREQIDYLVGLSAQRGLSLVPLRLYIKDRRAKVELGLVRGRRMYDKRAVISQREAEREMRRATKASARRF